MSNLIVEHRSLAEDDLRAFLPIEREFEELSARTQTVADQPSPPEPPVSPMLAIGTGFAALTLAALMYTRLPGW